MIYRDLVPSDMEAIFNVRVKTWHNPQGAEELERMGITPTSVGERMQASHRGWVAEQEGRVVGFAMGKLETGEMWVIAVLPEYENQGVGRQLLTHVEEWLGLQGWKEIWLTTDPDENVRAVGFYRHLGWVDWKIENGDRFMRKPVNKAS